MCGTGRDRAPHSRVFLAPVFQAVSHEPQQAALPAVSLIQYTLYRLLFGVKENQTLQAEARPLLIKPTLPSLPVSRSPPSLCGLG